MNEMIIQSSPSSVLLTFGSKPMIGHIFPLTHLLSDNFESQPITKAEKRVTSKRKRKCAKLRRGREKQKRSSHYKSKHLSLNKSFSQNDNLKRFISNERKIPVKADKTTRWRFVALSLRVKIFAFFSKNVNSKE